VGLPEPELVSSSPRHPQMTWCLFVTPRTSTNQDQDFSKLSFTKVLSSWAGNSPPRASLCSALCTDALIQWQRQATSGSSACPAEDSTGNSLIGYEPKPLHASRVWSPPASLSASRQSSTLLQVFAAVSITTVSSSLSLRHRLHTALHKEFQHVRGYLLRRASGRQSSRCCHLRTLRPRHHLRA
jgi:hypothetical protein